MFFRRYEGSNGGKWVARSLMGYHDAALRGRNWDRMSYDGRMTEIGTVSGSTRPM